jgi:hypothetical protein
MGNSNSCWVGDPDAPPPPNCGHDEPPPPPKAVPNLAIRQGQQSTNTFDTSLQRPVFMGISPLHL